MLLLKPANVLVVGGVVSSLVAEQRQRIQQSKKTLVASFITLTRQEYAQGVVR